MEMTEAVALKLISEIKKPGRECIYDLSNSFYKNNHRKQNIWAEVANAVGISRTDCQIFWKSLRRRHKAAINKSNGRNGTERVEIKGFSKLLLTEMDYFTEDKKPTVTNYNSLNTQSLFEEMARDPDVNESSMEYCDFASENCSSSLTPINTKSYSQKKRPKIEEVEEEYENSIKSLNDLTAAVLEASSTKRDPFFQALEDEFSKVPEENKSKLKVKLLTLVVENQK